MKTKNSSLHKAKTAKNDEFYTQLTDIEREMRHYKEHFRGKVIYCNCDDPRESKFFHFFSYQFETLGLKKLIAVAYKEGGRGVYSEYNGDLNKNRVPDIEEIGVKELVGDGDFRSTECIEIMKEADIVITNPPFSLFREYVQQLVDLDKKFLLVGNMNAITYKETFKLIKAGKLWLGINTPSKFEIPEHYPLIGSAYRNEEGKKIAVLGNVVWFTNLPHTKRNEELILYKNYTPEEYPTYDNYDAINVNKVKEIPMDYFKCIGVPISFLGSHNPEQFEICGTQRWFYDTALGTTNGKTLVKGKETYDRIFIKRTKQNEN